MPLLDSDALYSVDYDRRSAALTVTFKDNRRTYAYDRVPKHLYDELLAAESHGIYFNLHIKPYFPHREIRPSA
jgi:hypothetical protein